MYSAARGIRVRNIVFLIDHAAERVLQKQLVHFAAMVFPDRTIPESGTVGQEGAGAAFLARLVVSTEFRFGGAVGHT